ncbi:D-glucuronyl C5-epimerase family protein [Vibrio breoganii]|uniref:D-glucuronyl C5-epimerase family protein n=1 Tax=Vibrio breoganii TaxID=553239 RepID=UPI000C82A725|nr:D-glucuronyl C5-epimerase family protein [Vibrio breoganii]PML99985.1 hypothetical protein BCT64_18325 [Vibrio breoganii]PMN70145.1 hypothetical protein BCT28_18030 [Vibrio breoganii]
MSKLLFYIKKGIKDLTSPLIYEYLKDINDFDKYYYVKYDLTELLKGRSQNFSFDSKGIPIIPHYIDSENNTTSYHYFPIAIGQLGLAYLHDYSDNENTNSLNQFYLIADWFLEHQTPNGLWLSDTNVPKYGLETGWSSAMSQGRAISVLIRAYLLTDKIKYLSAAEKGVKSLISESSLVANFNGPYLLEYPSKHPPKVLNGFVFSLYGLIDYYKVKPCDQVQKEINTYLETLKRVIPLYDLGYWTSYDLDHLEYNKPLNIATSHYHSIHITQLRSLSLLTKDDYFSNYADKWEGYNRNKLSLFKVYWIKTRKVLKF